MAYKDKTKQANAAHRHYLDNKDKIKRRARAHNNRMRQELKGYVRGYLSGHPCIDCGESDPVVLDFDHRDRKLKRFNVSKILRQGGYSLQTLIEEIAKCDIRCANCHRRKTYRENQELFGNKKLPPLPLFEE